MFCRRESLRRYSRGTEVSGKFFSWRSNSSLWTRSRTFCLEIKMRSPSFPGLHETSPPEATRKRLSHLSALNLVWPQTDSLFQGPEKRVFGPVVYLDLFVVGGAPAEPVVWHFSGDRRRLPLVAAADDRDALALEPVEEDFQCGAGHCADLVPDTDTGDHLLSHLFGRPLCICDLGTRLAGTRIVKKTTLFSGHKRYLFGRNLLPVEI